MKRFAKTTFFPVLLATATYAFAATYLWAVQDRHIFMPGRELTQTPADYALAYEDVYIPSPAGTPSAERVHAWWIPADQSPHRRVLLYLHGSAFNISANVEHARRFHRLGFSVLLISYRGYGISVGDGPSEKTMYEDAVAAWNYLRTVRKIAPERIMIYGHSLGGAVAIDLAVKKPASAGVIAEATFTSIRDVAALNSFYRLFPLDLLIEHAFDSLSKIDGLTVPVLFLHGTADSSIPYEMSRRLYERTPGPKHLTLILGGGHNNSARVGGEKYLREVAAFAAASLVSDQP